MPDGTYRARFLKESGGPPWACCFCREPIDHANLLYVHHVDENRTNHALVNLAAAHPGCHTRWHKLGRLSNTRRITIEEERRVLAVTARLQRSRAALADARTERDQVIVRLLTAGRRIGDIAEILGVTHKAVRDSRDRALGKRDQR